MRIVGPSTSLARGRMRSFDLHRLVGVALAAALLAAAPSARAQQQQPRGFALDRLYTSAPGAGWVVMDTLDTYGSLGGAMSVTTNYALRPMRVSDGTTTTPVVTDQLTSTFAFGLTYERFRLYLDMHVPLLSKGEDASVGDYRLTGPRLDVASNPDTIWDTRLGIDARLFGAPRGPFRLGLGAQLLFPNGQRADYGTDGTYRAMGRLLFAGDAGYFVWAGHAGVHVRPLDDSPAPVSPQGSELLFGAAAGVRAQVNKSTTLVFGPEIYGATAFRSFFGSTSTALEALMTGRLEGDGDGGPHLRVKLGAGGGLNQTFGAPEWRVVFAFEVFGHFLGRHTDGSTAPL